MTYYLREYLGAVLHLYLEFKKHVFQNFVINKLPKITVKSRFQTIQKENLLLNVPREIGLL